MTYIQDMILEHEIDTSFVRTHQTLERNTQVLLDFKIIRFHGVNKIIYRSMHSGFCNSSDIRFVCFIS